VTTAIGGGFIASPESASRRGFIDLQRRVKALEDAESIDGARGEVAFASISAATAAVSAITDVPGLSVTWEAEALRVYKVTVWARIVQNTSASTPELNLRDASSTTLTKSSFTQAASSNATHVVIHRYIPGAGSQTAKASLASGAGTANVFASSTQLAFILVEDIGTEADGAYLLTEGGDYITAEDGTKLTTE
jgi:hypothetical protein